jgi:hypothetical protein
MRLVVLAGVLCFTARALAADPVLQVRARTALRLDAVECSASELVLRGSFVDESLDSPLANRTVNLLAESASLTEHRSEVTDENGRFIFRLMRPQSRYRFRLTTAAAPAKLGLYDAPTPLVREFDSTQLTFAGSAAADRGAPILSAASLSRPRADWAFLVPPALTLLGMGIVTWRRRRRASAVPQRRAEAVVNVPRTFIPTTCLTTQGDDFGLSGRVRDALTKRPVAAELQLSDGLQVRTLPLPESGDFSCEGLGPGLARVRIQSPTHLVYDRQIALPHRGELRALEIELSPIRARLLDRYLELARVLQVTTQHATVREVAAQLRSRARKPSASLEALRRLVEEAYWGPRPATMTVLEEAERLIADLSAG